MSKREVSIYEAKCSGEAMKPHGVQIEPTGEEFASGKLQGNFLGSRVCTNLARGCAAAAFPARGKTVDSMMYYVWGR